jgi:RHS repeat-associated protein
MTQTSYRVSIRNISDYSPFGVGLDERTLSTYTYRYGFQAQEVDDEVKGDGNSVNYKYRMHDPRIGRFFAVDPLSHKYPFYSPYVFSGNRVIDAIELEGLEPSPLNLPKVDKIKYSAGCNGIDEPITFTGNAIISIYQGVSGLWNSVGDNGIITTGGFVVDGLGNAVEQIDAFTKHPVDYYNSMSTADFENLLGSFIGIKGVKMLKSTPEITIVAKGPMLSNKQARILYNKRLDGMNTNVSPTKQNAQSIVTERNGYKSYVRDHMKDRKAADRLNEKYPIQDFDYYEKKYKAQGFEGEKLYERIIKSGNKGNEKVNKKFGL